MHALYSIISDRELDDLAEQIKQDFPNCGYRMMQGHLLRQGHRIPHARIRNCLHRIDPDGVAIDGLQPFRDGNTPYLHLYPFGILMATIN